jgi:diguanylate cyclase
MRALRKSVLAMACLFGAAAPAAAQSSFAAHTALQWPGVLTGAFLGFLLLPVAYNIAFFVILRERFLIWQGIRSVIIVLLTISLSSLPLGQFLSADGYARQVMINILFDAAIAVSGPFLRSFVEPGMLSPRMHKLLGWKVLLVALSTPAMLMANCPPAYMMFRNLVLVSVLILLCTALAQAIWRGSRAAKFQAAAWFCLLLVCGISLFHDVFPAFTVRRAGA